MCLVGCSPSVTRSAYVPDPDIGELEGVVIDRATGRPLAGARIAVDDEDIAVADEADDRDADGAFEAALSDFTNGRVRRGVRIVDARAASAGNSIAMAGVDLTTIELVQDESVRSHKEIGYWHLDAKLVAPCTALVTTGYAT